MKYSLSSAEFKQVMKTAKSLSAGDLLFKYSFNKNPKLGFIVSKKYGNAVQRNLFKRRCRSAYNAWVASDNAGISVIVRPKKQQLSNESIINGFDILKDRFHS